MSPRLGIILVNYQRADDTIECLESVLRSTIPLRIAVVDNSSDGSLDAIAAWARGERPAPVPAQLPELTAPPVAKPVPHVRLTAAEARARPPGDERLALIDAGGNLGFAAGNNIGLAHLARDAGLDAFWLLNNDTVAAPDAAAAVLAAVTGNIGMLGTQVRFYHRPGVVQALNGHRFDRWTGTSRGIGAESPSDAPIDAAAVRHDTDFVLGASLAVSRAFLETIGPMAEDYFLYFEEVDWAYRNAGRFEIGFAADAVVWHKEGGSIGSSSQKGARGGFSDYYLLRSKLRFVSRHLPNLLPVHWAVAIGQIGLRLVRRQPAKARIMIRALLGLKY